MTFAEAYQALENEKNVRFADAIKVATNFFGLPRIKGSHHIFKMGWPGDPRVNLQPEGNKAKAYQVGQLREAIQKLEAMNKAKKEDQSEKSGRK